MATPHDVPIKAGGVLRVEDTKVFNNEVFWHIVGAGLKDFLNRGMTKIGPIKGASPEQLEATKAKAMEIAQKNLQNLIDGKLPRVGRAKGDKIPGVVMTEARRLARDIIKDEIKAAGGKISHYKSSDITSAANEYLKSDAGKSLIEKAKATVASREEELKTKPKVDLEALQNKLGIKADPEKVAKAEAKKAEQAKAKEAGAAVLAAAAKGQVRTRKGSEAQAKQ